MDNVIIADISKSNFCKTKTLFRFNYGQRLKIVGIDMPQTYEVHFSNDLNGVSKTQIGDAEGVRVPREYFEPGKTIYAWLFLHAAEDSGETVAQIMIPISPRATITHEAPLPEEEHEISQLVTQLNNAVTQTGQDLEDASAAAAAARGAQLAAETAKAGAEAAAETAGTYAASAASSAETANSMRVQAVSAKNEAETAMSQAQTARADARSAATSSQQAAQTSVDAAQVSVSAAGEAATSASAARESAADAQTSKQAAAQSATAASQSAATASTAKNNAETAKVAAQAAQTSAEAAAANAAASATAAAAAQGVAESAIAQLAEVPVESGSGVGSVKTKDFTDVNGTTSIQFAGGLGSFSEGSYTQATGQYSHAEGKGSLSYGYSSHAEGTQTQANGNYSHAEGRASKAVSVVSHAEGRSTNASSAYQHVQGKYNVIDDQSTYADIVGNGTADNDRSNAFALTWTGDGKYAGDVYVHTNNDSSGGTKLATINDLPTKVSDLTDDSGHYTKPANGIPAADLEETYLTQHQDISGKANSADLAAVATSGDYDDLLNKPTIPDVQINGSSIVENGVANIPYASDTAGVVKVYSNSFGVQVNNGYLSVSGADRNIIKDGGDTFRPIVSGRQHMAAFYGLAKAAGADEKNSTESFGTYSTSAKTAIQTMLDVPSTAAMNTAISTAVSNINSMQIHICTAQEYDAQTGVPTIQNPDASTFYLVPGGEAPNLYIEWVYTNSAWEQFGSASIDLSGYALKADTVLDTTLSRGRKENTTIGDGSFAFGSDVEASGGHSHAEGLGTVASGGTSFAFGGHTIANGSNMFVAGRYNVESDLYPLWQPNTTYVVGDKVHHVRELTIGGKTVTTHAMYKCITDNNDENFTVSHWEYMDGIANKTGDTAFIIGNGTGNDKRSNAYVLDWDGNGHYMGDVYVGANADSSGGEKLATAAEIPVESGTGIGSIKTKDFIANNVTCSNVASGAGSFAEGGSTTASGGYSHAEGYGTQATGSNSHAEGSTTIASTRMAHAEGWGTEASGAGSHAEGGFNIASGDYSHAEGGGNQPQVKNIASGNSSHAEGYTTEAAGSFSHAEGAQTIAKANGAHTEGLATIATGRYSHISGKYNVEDSYSSWPEWVANTEYAADDKVKVTSIVDNETTVTGYICKTANNDAEFTSSNWTKDTARNYVEIIGNGNTTARSNARALSWEGNEYLKGDVYVRANADSSGGTKLVSETDYATQTVGGVVKVDNSIAGLRVLNGFLMTSPAQSDQIKAGANGYQPLQPGLQHAAAFYGLAKAAGDTTQASSANAVGTYTTEAKSAIRAMIGASNGDDLIAVQDAQPTSPETKLWMLETAPAGVSVPTVSEMETALAGKVGDVQVNGVSVVSNGVANMPILGNEVNQVGKTIGLIRLKDGYCYGFKTFTSGGEYCLAIKEASDTGIKQSKVQNSNGYGVIDSTNYHKATFYGLAKAADADMKDIANTTVGIYPDAQKAAIQHMLGTDTNLADYESDTTADQAYAIGELFMLNGKLHQATAVIAIGDTLEEGTNCSVVNAADVFAHDVQVNGTSIVSSGVANVPVASTTNLGVVKCGPGLQIGSSNEIKTSTATSANIKAGTESSKPIVPSRQHESVFYGLATAAGDATQAASDNAVGTYTDDAKAAIRTMLGAVGDVQVNGTSVVSNGAAEIPVGGQNTYGVFQLGDSATGLYLYNNKLTISPAGEAIIKLGSASFMPIVPLRQHTAAFYGLAKAAGDTTQSASSNAVGVYTDNAKASIKAMLGIVDGSTGTVDITGATPTINAVENTRYVCGEVTSLSFTPPSSGISIVRFTSGSTVTVLTIPSTVKFPEWFDPTTLETNTIYEICVTDGTFGAVMSWAL